MMKYLFALILSMQVLLANEPKVLVLIVASDNLPVYIEEQKIWRSYMHLDREHFEAYFIKANPELQSNCEISYDVIWSKVETDVYQGMVHRTIASIEALMPRLEEFDYVLRTNLSSFYIFPRLLEFIKTLPKENCYCGFILCAQDIPFVTGAGILLSRDMAKKMVHEQHSLYTSSCGNCEDVIMGKFFYDQQINRIAAPRLDFSSLNEWVLGKDFIGDDIFHIRTKNHNPDRRIDEEVCILSELVQMFYE